MRKYSEERNIKTYLTALITEKGFSVDSTLNREGHIGLTWENLIEFCEQLSESDQEKIIDTCTEIDFFNRDVFHYLNFLVDGMIQSFDLFISKNTESNSGVR